MLWGYYSIDCMEYAAGCYKAGRAEDVFVFERFLRDNYFEVREINAETAMLAAEIRGKAPGLKAMDALQLASAINGDCQTFFTSDKRLIKMAKSLKIPLDIRSPLISQ